MPKPCNIKLQNNPLPQMGQAFKNSYNQGIFRNKGVSALVLVFILVVALNLYFSQNYQISASDLTKNNIADAVNKERTLRNQTSLNSNSKLAAAAQIKATDMIVRNYFSHTDPEGNYIWPTVVAQGYSPYLQLGENLAVDFYNTESLVAAWMNSPTHRANILNEGFEDQGMGLDFGDTNKNQHYSSIVNTFGTLIAQKTAPPPPPPSQEVQTPKVESETVQSPQKPPTTETEIPQEQQGLLQEQQRPAQTIALRGSEGEEESSFTTGKSQQQIEIPTTTQTSPPVQPQSQPKISFNPLKFNRYLAIAFGGLLLIVLFLDIRELLQKKLLPLDKKVNNIIILILALIIIALMYWL